ncbi:MAG: four helix bundle protein [Saprospiraceae bacterium]
MHHFKQLRIWNDAMDLAVDIYRLSREFPEDERFALTQQLRRSMVSVPSNIAEGAGRNTDKEFNYFLGVSLGSSCEVSTQLELAQRLGYVSIDATASLLTALENNRSQVVNLQTRLNIKK